MELVDMGTRHDTRILLFFNIINTKTLEHFSDFNFIFV